MRIDFQSAEPWAMIELEDGSVIKAKIAVKDVMRYEGEYDQAGNPVYWVAHEVVWRVVKAGKRGEPTIKPKGKAAQTDADPGAAYR